MKTITGNSDRVLRSPQEKSGNIVFQIFSPSALIKSNFPETKWC